MSKRPKFRSPIAAAVHEGVRDSHEPGLADKKTMRDFDVRCLTQTEGLTAKEIAAPREAVKAAPAEKGGIFAALRSSPLVGADLDFTRVRTTGRKIRL